MASAHVMVRVLDGQSVVEDSVRRPVRLTPNGYAGVAYAQAVYPLFPENTIDITGPSWEIEDCHRFLLAGATIPYAPRAGATQQAPGPESFDGDWDVESSEYGHYVVFNSPQHVAGHVVGLLETAGLPVQRWDVSHRVTNDGKFYDWFARLRFKGSHDECIVRVAAAFSAAGQIPAVEEPTRSAEGRLAESEAQVERLLDEVVQLRTRLATAEEETIQLRAELHESTAREVQVSNDLDQALAHQRSLLDQLGNLRDVAPHDPQTSALIARQSETDRLLAQAMIDKANLHRLVATLTERAVQDKARIRTLEGTTVSLQERLEEISQQDQQRRRFRQRG